MSSLVTITVSKEEGNVPVTIIRLNGKVDASNVEKFDTTAMAEIDKGARDVLIDMEKVDFMSSAGFRVIHKIYQATHDGGEGGAHLKLLNPPEESRRLIKTLGFEQFVDVVEGDLSTAVNSF